MDVSELKDKVLDLQASIAQLLREFERTTGTRVERLGSIERQPTTLSQRGLGDVQSVDLTVGLW